MQFLDHLLSNLRSLVSHITFHREHTNDIQYDSPGGGWLQLLGSSLIDIAIIVP